MKIGIWEVDATSEDFLKRYEKAKKEKIRVNDREDAPAGTFLTGSSDYLTSIESCSCVDFRNRKLPCKHILAVAIYQGLLPRDLVALPEKRNVEINIIIPSFWQWQETSEAEQVKRFISAKTAECTPVSVDKVNIVGVFSGKHGIYNVFPDRCECFDFAQRGKPCKHIYRFAMELGVLQTEDVKSDLSRVQLPAELKKKMLERVIDCLEGYPEVLQREIMDVLYKAMYRADKSEPYVTDSPAFFNVAMADHLVETAVDYKKLIGARPQKATVDPLIEMGFSFPAEVEKNKKARFEWCLEHAEEIGPLVFPQMVYIVPSGELSAVKSKVYTYLCRKYRDVEYYDENMNQILIPYGAEEMFFRGADGRKKVHLSFPDDEITALLDKHGTNRCRNID